MFNPHREPTTRTCALCGYAVWAETTLALARYRGGAEPFKAIVRCTDREACRQRFERTGRRWPLIEAGEQIGRPARPIEVERAQEPRET